MTSLICDEEGVPLLIQHMVYHCGLMVFEVTFFNGQTQTVSDVIDGMDLFQKQPTKEQWVEVYINLNAIALHQWSEWFPYAD